MPVGFSIANSAKSSDPGFTIAPRAKPAIAASASASTTTHRRDIRRPSGNSSGGTIRASASIGVKSQLNQAPTVVPGNAPPARNRLMKLQD